MFFDDSLAAFVMGLITMLAVQQLDLRGRVKNLEKDQEETTVRQEAADAKHEALATTVDAVTQRASPR